MAGFLKLCRTPTTLELLGDPVALHLLTVIAFRARFTDEKSFSGLTFGQAHVGDFAAIGLTEKEYRCAKQRLARAGLVRFDSSRQGTVATLLDSRVYSLRDERDASGSVLEQGGREGGQKGGRFSEEKPQFGADDWADAEANKGRTKGGRGATNSEGKKEKNEQKGEAPVLFPWATLDQLPDQLRAELASAYPDAADQQHVLDTIRGNELRFNARHTEANWLAVAVAAIQREAKADDARTGRNGRTSGFADTKQRTRQRAKPERPDANLAEPQWNWRATALAVANETADADTRERRIEAIEQRNAWVSFGDEFRQAIIARGPIARRTDASDDDVPFETKGAA